MKIEDDLLELPVSMRCHNAFKRNGIQNLAELTKLTKFDLLMLQNLGKKSVQEIIEVLAEMGLSLSTGPEDCYHWLEKGKQINRQLKGLANMKEDTTPIDPTWMEKTGGYAKDMTMRDEFAGRAMQSEFANGFHESDFPYCARRAYKLADAMLAAREAK
jgi:hypothetical protein